jgi:hypothetical protein
MFGTSASGQHRVVLDVGCTSAGSLHIGPQSGFAGAAGIFAFVDCAQGVLSLLTGVSEADDGIGSESNALAFGAAAKALNP